MLGFCDFQGGDPGERAEPSLRPHTRGLLVRQHSAHEDTVQAIRGTEQDEGAQRKGELLSDCSLAFNVWSTRALNIA